MGRPGVGVADLVDDDSQIVFREVEEADALIDRSLRQAGGDDGDVLIRRSEGQELPAEQAHLVRTQRPDLVVDRASLLLVHLQEEVARGEVLDVRAVIHVDLLEGDRRVGELERDRRITLEPFRRVHGTGGENDAQEEHRHTVEGTVTGHNARFPTPHALA